MRIDKMTASFGKLENASLTLSPGLTVIEAPNEGGKSTWCALIRTMLYGLSTRERGALADKNRYAPWSGGAMRGTMELTDEQGRRITLTRDTARANAPMGHFSAVYTDTAEDVPALSGGECGETLLGVPREVFERSAFIRQSGLAIDQNAELERRIAALFSTGEEDTSFSEAYSRLKAQLNARRHNKTGTLPALESQLAALEETLRQMEMLRTARADTQAERCALEEREKAVRAELALHALADAAEEERALHAAERNAAQAAQTAETLRRALAETHIPPEETLRQLKAQSETLCASAEPLRHAEEALRRAESAAEAAQARCRQHRLSGHPPEETRRSLQQERQAAGTSKPAHGALWMEALLPTLIPPVLVLTGTLSFYAAGGIALIYIGIWLAAFLWTRRGATRALAARQAAFLGQYRCASEAELEELLEEYEALCAAAQEAETNRQRLSDMLALRASARKSDLASLLSAVSLFHAAVAVPEDAALAVEDALRQRKAAQDAEALAREQKLRYDIKRQNRRFPPCADPCVRRPNSDAGALRQEQAALAGRIAEKRQSESRAEGQLRTLGDYAELSARRETLLAQRATLQAEYDAVADAMEALSGANLELQSRFSPELGKCTAEIFSVLSGGKYDRVLLDKELNVSAEEAGVPIARAVALLSQGCADQLYLSLRLAICRMVLPQERRVPLILDDALINFDDGRMALALDFLRAESRERQILLFTCQSRERAYLRDAADVCLLP